MSVISSPPSSGTSSTIADNVLPPVPTSPPTAQSYRAPWRFRPRSAPHPVPATRQDAQSREVRSMPTVQGAGDDGAGSAGRASVTGVGADAVAALRQGLAATRSTFVERRRLRGESAPFRTAF